MTYKNLIIYFNIFILTITIAFSNIYTNFSYAETTTQAQTSATTEASTETTTEAPSVIKNYCESDKQLNVQARAAILVDANTGLTLYEKNADEVLYPASITKILTSLIACEYGKFDELVTHSDNAINGIGYGSSTMGMVVGETISLREALYGILMCSANETCMAVAEHISGTVDAFVQKMNEKAAELGCTNTHFANPHGFHDPNHYTTARDMSKITMAAVKNETFSKIWGTVVHTLPATNKVNEPRGLYNKAKILDDESQYYYPYILGAKTGFHDEALNTLVCCAEKDGVKLITVIMKDHGANLAYADTKLLFDYGFTQYETKTVYTGSGYSGEIPTVQQYKGNQFEIGTVKTEVSGEISALVPKFIDESSVTATPQLDENVELPVKKGDVVGKMLVSYNDYELGELNITAAADADRADTMTMALKWLKLLAVNYSKPALIFAIPIVGVLIVLWIIIKIIRAIARSRRRKKRLKLKNKKLVNPLLDDEENEETPEAEAEIQAEAPETETEAEPVKPVKKHRVSQDAAVKKHKTNGDISVKKHRASGDKPVRKLKDGKPVRKKNTDGRPVKKIKNSDTPIKKKKVVKKTEE